MADSEIKFNHYYYDDLFEGQRIKIEHSVVYDTSDNDISDLTSMSIEKVEALREKNIIKEQNAFDKVKQAAFSWEKHAAVTAHYDRALEYLRTPETEHSSNKWVDENYGYKSISNKVYKMMYKIDDDYSWRTQKYRFRVTWNVFLNTPNVSYRLNLASNEKICHTKEEAEKYMQGRIKAFSYLFTEISPIIPDIYAKYFSVSGKLLHGYTTETMKREKSAESEKPSVRKQLDSLKSQNKQATKQQKIKENTQPEI